MKKFLSMVLCAALLLTNLILNTPQKVQALEAQSGSKPDYVGTVKLDGDSTFDSDNIVNSDANQWRWLSYPESRLVVNPGGRPKYDGGMNLNVGLFVNGIKSLKSLQKVQMSTTGQSAHDWTSLSTAWYPYKLTAHAVYGTDGTVDMSEFFVDKNTFVRYIEASDVAGKTMTMSGSISGMSVLGDNSILVDAGDYYFVYKVMLLNDDSSINQIIKPTINGSVWTATIPFTTSTAKAAFSLTVAAKADDSTSATAVSRSSSAVNGKIADKLAATKAYWDGKLRKVPAPTVWGIQGGMDAKGVTAEQHERSFYAAWAFNYQNILEPTQETGHKYYQVTLGKASLWPNGASDSPNSCAWESFFDIQQLAYVEPDIAWNAVEGFISAIDDNGVLAGECLPSQKAHTVWVCYQQKKDDQKLAELYPKIKKYLQWRFNNPRWIYFSHNYKDEKDISFVAQWYSDVNYAIKICQVLGRYDDIAMWENLKDQMGDNARKWFFTPAAGDPADKVYNTYFADSGTHYNSARPKDVENYINSLLVADLPADLQERIVQHYINFQKPAEDLIGFDFYKYGDGSQIAYGLYEKGKSDPRIAGMWQQFTNAALRSIVRTVEFCEEARPNVIGTAGVTPSTFGASTVVDFTYLNNGMRIDLGAPVAIADGNTGLQTTADSNVTVYTIKGTHPNLPKTVTVQDKNGVSLDAYVTWDTVTADKYASAGTVTVNGKVADTDLSVTATVKVYGGDVTTVPVTARTVTGVLPTLPSTVSATYQDGSMTQNCVAAVTWDAMKQSDFAAPGTVKVGGTIGFNGQKIEAAVDVIDAAGISSLNGKFTVAKGDTLQLSVKDSDGTPLSVTWGIENPGYDAAAGINQGGTLLGATAGTVTVTAQVEGVSALLKKEITVSEKNAVNLAYGGTATASGQMDSARSPAQAVDEDSTSMWRADTNDASEWFQVQMKQSLPATGVKIRWFEGNQPQAFVLKASDDGSNWKTVYNRTSKVDTGTNNYSEIIVFDQPQQAKYYRMESSKAGSYAMGIIEFQVFGNPEITVPVKSLQITSSDNQFEIHDKGITLKLGTTATPTDASDTRVEWKVTNVDGSATDKASISSAGILAPLKNGTVLVTATAVDGSGAKATQSVTLTNQDISNVALNKPASATSDGGGANAPSAAVDGNRSTRWGSKKDAPQSSFFTIDLQGEYIISTVALYCDTGAYPIDYKLQYSMDGKTWSDIQTVTGNSSPNQTLIFNPVHAKYVRTLSSKTSNSTWGYSIFEFEVYGRAIAQKTDLQKFYEDNKDKANNNYTEATWTAFQQALNTANTVLQNADASQDEVDGAYSALQQAVSGLKAAADKTALQKLYDDNKDKANNNYTEATWNTFQQALNSAKTILQNADAAQDEVDGACTTLQQAVSGLKVVVNKTDLQKLYDDNKDKANSNYTEATWNAFQEALNAAKAVLQNAAATQEQADNAKATLQQAVSGLRAAADKTDLQKLYDDNKNKANSNYTEATWNAFQEALNAAKAVLQNADATQEQIDSAKATLQQAVSGLKVVVDKTDLQKLYDDNKNKANSNYTEATWNDFQQALNAVKAVLQNADSTQGQVDNAKAALDTARKGLTVKEAPQPQAIEIKHEETGITVTAPANVLPDGATLHVDVLSQGNGFQLAQNALSDVGSKLKVLDIYLLHAGKVIQPDGDITVRIPIPTGFDKTRLALYYIAADGKKTQLPIQIEGNEVVFHTTHFSTYALVETAASSSSQNGSSQNSSGQQTGGQSPQTGEAPLTIYFVAGAAAAFAVIVLLSRRKKTVS